MNSKLNILFLSISNFSHLDGHSISTDLLHELRRNGHNVHVVCGIDRGVGEETSLKEEAGCKILRVKIGKNKKANLIEKGITTLLLPHTYKKAIRKYFPNIKFDWILYPTPPITHLGTANYIKRRDNAKTFLLLKDIFPQNAVDLNMFSKKSFLYKYFRCVEKNLYKNSDYIGCMSQANVDYVLKHNPEVSPDKVVVCPNSVEPIDNSLPMDERLAVRRQYNIPEDKKIFIYGGNLGRPQGIPFLIECLKSQADNKEVFFVIAGGGTEYKNIEEYIETSKQKNVMLMPRLPKVEYDRLVASCDVGLIFLDKRFTIPNFPSRLLAHMQAKMPVMAVTDSNTDIGKVITENGFGWWVEAGELVAFDVTFSQACEGDFARMGERAWNYLLENYTVEKAYQTIKECLQ
ncbi:MAG: glycosyltransferase family 4 protein [Clostridia bacterium]|nr:glycosyltransferase family 4 protein [Clostridia bacterium]